jgi:hypothetical protein
MFGMNLGSNAAAAAAEGKAGSAQHSAVPNSFNLADFFTNADQSPSISSSTSTRSSAAGAGAAATSTFDSFSLVNLINGLSGSSSSISMLTSLMPFLPLDQLFSNADPKVTLGLITSIPQIINLADSLSNFKLPETKVSFV